MNQTRDRAGVRTSSGAASETLRLRPARACAAALVAVAGLAALALPAAASAADLKAGWIEIDGAVSDRRSDMASLFGGSKGPVLRDLLAGLDKAAADPAIRAVVLRLKDAQMSAAHAEELSAGMRRLREAGKKVHVYSETYGPTELRIGAAADDIIIQSGGAVMLPGVFMEELYLADMFKWAGIQPDFVQVGDYKGASEMFANAKPSKAWDENINGLLDSMYANLRSTLKAGRGLSDEQLDKAMATGWMASDKDAKAVGLVTSIIDMPEIDAHVSRISGGAPGAEVDWAFDLVPAASKLDTSNPFTLLSAIMKKPDHSPKRETIAVLHIDGPIIDGESGGGGLFGGGGGVGSRTVRNALRDIEDNDLIKGLVVRIDSPGGSAIASEIIWQGVRRVSAKGKPVYVSVGGMAASGGYYILVAGDRVWVNPSSIVGSIGVVGGKLSFGPLMEKVHINTVVRARGPAADMFSMSKPWTDTQRAMVRQKMTETYDQFTSRVTAGRKGIDLARTAEGRLFTGQRAIELKMADEIGGLEDAVKAMASAKGLNAGAFDVMDYPPPRGLEEILSDFMGASGPRVASGITGPGINGELAGVVKAAVGPAAFGVLSDAATALMQMRREPVLLVSPRVLIFR